MLCRGRLQHWPDVSDVMVNSLTLILDVIMLDYPVKERPMPGYPVKG